MRRFIEILKDFINKNKDIFYYISEDDWNNLCDTIRDINVIVDWTSFFTERYSHIFKETSELISDCSIQMEYLKMHSKNFSDFILITYLVLNHQDEFALLEFNKLLWEDKILFCRFILGDNVVIYIK